LLSSVLLLELLKTLQLFLSAAIDAEPAFTRRTHEQIQRPVASGYVWLRGEMVLCEFKKT